MMDTLKVVWRVVYNNSLPIDPRIKLSATLPLIVLTCFFTVGYSRHRTLGVGFCRAGYDGA